MDFQYQNRKVHPAYYVYIEFSSENQNLFG